MTDPHGADAPHPDPRPHDPHRHRQGPDRHDSPGPDEPAPCDDLGAPPGSHAAAGPAVPDGAWAAPGPDDDLADAAAPGVLVPDPPAALELMLRLVGPERAGPPALWFALLDGERRLLPVVLPLADVPLRPDATAARQVVHVLADVLEREAPGGSAVVAVVRAAGGDQGSFERAWAHALVLAATDRALAVHCVVAIGEHRARVLPV